MTYNVFSGTLNPTQSVLSGSEHVEVTDRFTCTKLREELGIDGIITVVQ